MLQLDSSMSWLYLSILVATKNEYTSLSFAKSPLEMLIWINLVILSIKIFNLSSMAFAYGLNSIALLNKDFTKESEFWYIGSILAKSAITKYRMLPLVATEAYVFLVWCSSISVYFDSSILCSISPAILLESSSMLIKSFSSRIYSEVASANFLRISFSRSFEVFASEASVSTIWSFFASTSGFSATITSASNCCWSPSKVTVKLINVTLMQISGI